MEPHEAANGGQAEWAAGAPRALRAEARLPPRPDLPARQTSFVGRATELAELAELLAAPDCRLLTLIGPGGIGKTRLALEAAGAARAGFADGVAFVPLQGVATAGAMAPALAAAIGCTLTGPADARDQVARCLRPARLLLVLDNLEHLVGEAPWLGELLAEAPGLRLLATSRAALNLQEEWRYPLAGLALPAEGADDPAQVEQAEAIRLFVERARQVRPDFSLGAERAGVVRICRLVEGLPLALELAAAWVKTLSCAAIADEIERNLAFLATDLRNVPARHRSMRAAFDHSWALLAADERRVFQRLAPFRGGFTREAAERVAGATLPLLSSLVDKSLVRREADGRFHLHELLSQYADERLRAAPEDAAAVARAHRAYYLGFLADRATAMAGGGQREAMAAIDGELDNIRAAWARLDGWIDVELLRGAVHALALRYHFRGPYREGVALLEQAARHLRAAGPAAAAELALAAVLVDLARLSMRLGRLARAKASLEESLRRYDWGGATMPPGRTTDPQLGLAGLAMTAGDYAAADRWAAAARRRAAGEGQTSNLAGAWYVLANVALARGDPTAAQRAAARAYEAATEAGDDWFRAYCLNQLGHIALALGDQPLARRHYQASYDLRAEFCDPEGMALALAHLGKVALLGGDYTAARDHYALSRDLYREIGDRGGLAQALHGLAQAACATGADREASGDLAAALRAATEIALVPLTLAILATSGGLLVRRGGARLGVLLLAASERHPAGDLETRARARQLREQVALVPPPTAEPGDLDQLVAETLDALAALAEGAEAAPVSTPAGRPRPAPVDTLPEPLTARELAVLRLIAAGRSNREIAAELFLAVNTVRSYSQQLYGKLGVGSRTQAIARARDLGLLA